MSVYVYISVYWYNTLEQRETKKESDRQKEAEIPRGQVSGDMELAGVLFGIVMLADPSHV